MQNGCRQDIVTVKEVFYHYNPSYGTTGNWASELHKFYGVDTSEIIVMSLKYMLIGGSQRVASFGQERQPKVNPRLASLCSSKKTLPGGLVSNIGDSVSSWTVPIRARCLSYFPLSGRTY